jgi:hypothetical protein
MGMLSLLTQRENIHLVFRTIGDFGAVRCEVAVRSYLSENL